MLDLKKTMMIVIMHLFVSSFINAQLKIAVMDFKAGTGAVQEEADGISAIFGSYFTDPSKFTPVDRNQIEKVITEQGFHQSLLTSRQMARVGQLLNLQKMVVGDVNLVGGQYNVDVRIVDVETEAVYATDNATWTKGSSYRELIKNLATRLMAQINMPTSSVDMKAEKERKAVEAKQRMEEERILASIDPMEAAQIYILEKYNRDVLFVPSAEIHISRVIYTNQGVSLEAMIKDMGWEIADYVELSSIPAVNSILKSSRFWWTLDGTEGYDYLSIPCLNRPGHSVPNSNWTSYKIYDSRGMNYNIQQFILPSRQELGCSVSNYIFFANECHYPAMLTRDLNEAEALEKASQMKQTAIRKAQKTDEGVQKGQTKKKN